MIYKHTQDKKLSPPTHIEQKTTNMDIYDYCVSDNDDDSCSVKASEGDCHVLKQVINGKKVKITIYTTKYTPGSPIRNAVYGDYQSKCFVGKNEEYTFFKVSLSCNLGKNPVSKHLYYDSPEQYEKHFKIKLDQVIKTKWHNSQPSNILQEKEEETENDKEYTIIH
jgi:hypothetical protein